MTANSACPKVSVKLMPVAQEITSYVSSLFDVAGATKMPDGFRLLIVGLESTPERDLDEFRLKAGSCQLPGFERYALPKLESLLNLIRKQSFTAEPAGRCGYPLRGEINLKEAAVRAGLGNWGKSTLVLHPEYGNRLRFMALRTDAPLESQTKRHTIRGENPVCDGCTICIDACPERILEPYRMPETTRCLANVARMVNKDDRLIPCDICLRLCPANKEY